MTLLIVIYTTGYIAAFISMRWNAHSKNPIFYKKSFNEALATALTSWLLIVIYTIAILVDVISKNLPELISSLKSIQRLKKWYERE